MQKNKKIVGISIALIVILVMTGIGLFLYYHPNIFKTQMIVGYELKQPCIQGVNCEGAGCCYKEIGVGDAKEAVISDQKRIQDPTEPIPKCTACYSLYPNKDQPWDCREQDSYICIAQTYVNENFIPAGYTGCTVKVYSDDDYGNWAIGFCTECPEGMSKRKGYLHGVWASSSCEETQCSGNITQTKTCGDKSEIITQNCIDNLWVDTENKCCETDVTQTKKCSDGTTILAYQCVDENWARVAYCPEEGSGTNIITILYVVLIIIVIAGVVVLGIGIYRLVKKK